MRVLMTGASGFIGHGLLELFAAQGDRVIGIYRSRRPRIASRILDQVECLSGDLSNPVPLQESVDLIIHAAAHTHLDPQAKAQDYIRSNLVGTLNLVDYARKYPPGLFVYLSTISIYGEITTPVLSEETPLGHPGLYGASKYIGELILREQAEKITSVAIRLPGVVGKDYFVPWLGQTVLRAAGHQPIAVYNPDAPFNNVVDIHEIFRLIMHLTQCPLQGFTEVNLAASEPKTIRAVLQQIIALTGSTSPVEERRLPKVSFSISIARLDQHLGFKPSTTQNMIDRYIRMNREALLPASDWKENLRRDLMERPCV